MIVLLVLFILPAVNLLSQEIRVTAPDDILENEVFKVQYEILSYEPIKEMPDIISKDFETVNRPQVSTSRPSPFWGTNFYTLDIVYSFKAKKTGTLKLPQIEFVYEGKKVKSKEGKILVRKLPDREHIECFVKADLTKQSVKIGDTLTITYKLYSTKEISNILNMRIPRVRSFYYTNLSPSRLQYTEEVIDGINYKIYVLAKYLIQPTNLGTIEIPEASVDIEYTFPTGREKRDAWGRIYEELFRDIRPCIIAPITIRVHDMITI